MHHETTFVQSRASTDEALAAADLRRLLICLRSALDGPLDALTADGSAATVDVLMDSCSLRASVDNHIDVASSWRPREVIESLLANVGTREAAQLVSSSSSACEAEPSQVSAEAFAGWLPLSSSSASEQPRAVESLPVPDRSPREHHTVPTTFSGDDVFGLDGVRLQGSRSARVGRSSRAFGLGREL